MQDMAKMEAQLQAAEKSHAREQIDRLEEQNESLKE
jgi:hypothetical protein